MTDIVDFIHSFQFSNAQQSAQGDAIRGLIDTLGVAVSASQTDLSSIIRNHAAEQFGGQASRLWQDGRYVSPSGAALANAMTIDALDAHDGYKMAKGHVGCGVIPSVIAFAEAQGPISAQEFLSAVIIGYEIGSRAAVALHRSASDYHTSGAWVCIAVAAIGARILGLSHAQTREALGIAEFHGPRSQMMRCIDHPTMVKDGSGWGAMAGVSAAYLARDGFTGAPAVTTQGEEFSDIWDDLGTNWTISDQYIKLYPVCRWAQPPVEAVLAMMQEDGVNHSDIRSIDVVTFHEATRLTAIPTTSEQAQYSLPFSVAAAAVRGTIGFDEVSGSGLVDPTILDLAKRITLKEADAYNAVFPLKRQAKVEMTLQDGTVLRSPVTEAKGDPEQRLGADVIDAKFKRLVAPVMGEQHSELLLNAIKDLLNGGECNTVFDLLAGRS